MLFRSQGQMGPSPLGQIKDIISGLGTMANQTISGVTGNQTLGDWLASKLSTLLNQGGSQTSTTGGSPVSSVVVDPNSPLNIIDPNAPNNTGVNVDQTGNVTIPGITDVPTPYTEYPITPQ